MCYSSGLVKLFLSNLYVLNCIMSKANIIYCSKKLKYLELLHVPCVEKKSPRGPRQKEGACTTALSTHAPRIQSVYPDREMAIKGGGGGKRRKIKTKKHDRK